MPTYTGTELARSALREIGVLDPIEVGADELIADALAVGTDLLDSLRNDNLMVSGVTRAVYPLVSGQQEYSIGEGGDFDQDYPTEILRWSIIPDDTATDPIEQPQGRPLNDREWQSIRIKSQQGPFPSRMWYDSRYAAGFGRCQFWVTPDNNNVSAVLYMLVPSITSLVAATQYNLQPGFALLIKTGIGNELAESGRYEVQDNIAARVSRRYMRAKGTLKRRNNRTRPTPIRAEFIIGTNRRTLNIYSDS